MIDKFLKNLSDEIEYKFGTPWRYSNKSIGVVVPILKQDGSELGERVYMTLEEAKDQGVTFKDTGHIDRVILETPLRKPIFVRSGTALKSAGTQPRAVETSVVIIPQEQKEEDIPDIPEIIVTRREIPVRCIYSSKPISSSTKFEYGGFVPLEVGNALLSRSGQAATWNAVGNSTHRLMSSRSYGSSLGRTMRSRRITTDDLVGVMEDVDKFTGNIDEILAKVPLFEDQVGAVFMDMKNVVGLEMFDHPKSWESIHKEVEKRLGESLANEEEKTFFKPDYDSMKPLIFSFLKKLLESKKIETPHGITSTVTLRGDGIVGEATTINGKVIHLVGMRDDKKNKTDTLEGATRDIAQRVQNVVYSMRSFGSHVSI